MCWLRRAAIKLVRRSSDVWNSTCKLKDDIELTFEALHAPLVCPLAATPEFATENFKLREFLSSNQCNILSGGELGSGTSNRVAILPQRLDRPPADGQLAVESPFKHCVFTLNIS